MHYLWTFFYSIMMIIFFGKYNLHIFSKNMSILQPTQIIFKIPIQSRRKIILARFSSLIYFY